MTRTAMALGVLISLGVMLATVQTRIEIVREGYRRARLERAIEAEEGRRAILAAEYARRTGPERLLRLAERHGLELVPPRPARRPADRPAPVSPQSPDSGPEIEGGAPVASVPVLVRGSGRVP